MPVLSVPVLLNHIPYCYLVNINPATATIYGLISDLLVWFGGEEKRSTVRLRWIVNEVSPSVCLMI